MALSEWVSPVAYCEIDPYCQKVLLSRMSNGKLHKAPIWDDVKTLQSRDLPRIDIIYAGSPCQGFSINGIKKGLEDERSGLFHEVIRLAREIKPDFLFLENVPNITKLAGISIAKEISSIGMDARWCCLRAKDFGAPHVRDRWFLLAHSNREGCSGLCSGTKKKFNEPHGNVKYYKWDKWPENESPLLRMDDGIPFRMDRTKSLGNSVVPIQVKEAFKILMGL